MRKFAAKATESNLFSKRSLTAGRVALVIEKMGLLGRLLASMIGCTKYNLLNLWLAARREPDGCLFVCVDLVGIHGADRNEGRAIIR